MKALTLKDLVAFENVEEARFNNSDLEGIRDFFPNITGEEVNAFFRKEDGNDMTYAQTVDNERLLIVEVGVAVLTGECVSHTLLSKARGVITSGSRKEARGIHMEYFPFTHWVTPVAWLDVEKGRALNLKETVLTGSEGAIGIYKWGKIDPTICLTEGTYGLRETASLFYKDDPKWASLAAANLRGIDKAQALRTAGNVAGAKEAMLNL